MAADDSCFQLNIYDIQMQGKMYIKCKLWNSFAT